MRMCGLVGIISNSNFFGAMYLEDLFEKKENVYWHSETTVYTWLKKPFTKNHETWTMRPKY